MVLQFMLIGIQISEQLLYMTRIEKGKLQGLFFEYSLLLFSSNGKSECKRLQEKLGYLIVVVHYLIGHWLDVFLW